MILDEVQRLPALLSYIQGIADRNSFPPSLPTAALPLETQPPLSHPCGPPGGGEKLPSIHPGSRIPRKMPPWPWPGNFFLFFRTTPGQGRKKVFTL